MEKEKIKEILTIAGKRVRVSYAGKGSKCCEMCCFCSDYGCTGVGAEKEWPCKKFGTETAYFVKAEKDYKGLYEELVNSEWYKKYYQGASVGDSVAVEQSEEETHTLREWAQILAKNPDLRAEFDKMCPPQPIQGSIAPEVDFDELIKQEMVKVYETYTRPDYIEENTTEAAYDFNAYLARHFAEWGAEHLKR